MTQSLPDSTDSIQEPLPQIQGGRIWTPTPSPIQLNRKLAIRIFTIVVLLMLIGGGILACWNILYSPHFSAHSNYFEYDFFGETSAWNIVGLTLFVISFPILVVLIISRFTRSGVDIIVSVWLSMGLTFLAAAGLSWINDSVRGPQDKAFYSWVKEQGYTLPEKATQKSVPSILPSYLNVRYKGEAVTIYFENADGKITISQLK